MRCAGIVLDPWQVFVLERGLGETSDGGWSAFEVALVVPRQNGKNVVLEARELAGLFLFGEELILHSAHEFKTCAEAFRRIVSTIKANDFLERRVKQIRTGHGEESIELKSGARLRFVARSTGSGRGFSGDALILDEAFRLGGREMAALLPTLSARPNPQIWYASSSGMVESEQLLRVRKRALTQPVGRLAYFEWSADPELGLDDRRAWAQANPALGVRVSVDAVLAEREALGDWEFARERLGYWPLEASDQVIHPGVWRGLVDPLSQITGRLVFAADANPERSRATVAVAGFRDDGLVHLEIIDAREGTSWVPGRLAQLWRRWEPVTVVIDPAGPGGAWVPELDELGVGVQLLNGRGVVAACGGFFDAVTQRSSVRHLDQEPLNQALGGARKRAVGDAWAWHRRNSAVDISPLVAVTLAHYGLLVNASGQPLANIV